MLSGLTNIDENKDICIQFWNELRWLYFDNLYKIDKNGLSTVLLLCHNVVVQAWRRRCCDSKILTQKNKILHWNTCIGKSYTLHCHSIWIFFCIHDVFFNVILQIFSSCLSTFSDVLFFYKVWIFTASLVFSFNFLRLFWGWGEGQEAHDLRNIICILLPVTHCLHCMAFA